MFVWRLIGSHRYHPGIVQQAQGRSAETAVSPHYNNQSTVETRRVVFGVRTEFLNI
jgi:hypothetical protein